MKKSLLRRGMALGAALGVAVGTFMVAPPAEAVPPPNTVIITATGSDTTEEFMKTLLANPGAGTGTDNGRYNIPAFVRSAPLFYNVPSDTAPAPSQCPGRDYYTPEEITPPVGGADADVIAPNGSSAGRDALRISLSNVDAADDGCFEIARSSSGPRAIGTGADQDLATFEYYAFGLDAVSWASPSLNAPATLTRVQIQQIYNCTVTDWSQVGGGAGPIQRYVPQFGSGTRGFFISEILGLSSNTPAGGLVEANGCPAEKDVGVQENSGDEIDVADFNTAILPYSAGQWINQANTSINPTLDLRNEVKIKNLTATSAYSVDTTNGSTTITSNPVVNNRFTGTKIGAAITGANIPVGATITAIGALGQSATISAPATGTGVTPVVSVSRALTAVRWLPSGDGLWLPNNSSVSNPTGPIRESTVSLNNSLRDYFGVRYVFNVIDSTSPQYGPAKALVGFENATQPPAQPRAPLCNGALVTAVSAAGFQPLSTVLPADTPTSIALPGDVSCRRFS